MCQNQLKCILCQNSSETRKGVSKHGSYFRSSDQVLVQRFYCNDCGKSFSSASTSKCFLQKKRQFNFRIYELLVSGVSQRRAAILLGLNRKTVVRKFVFLGLEAQELLKIYRYGFTCTTHMQFDDLETFEHSKLKPLSATIAVDADTRHILGFRVSRMRAKGTIAALSRKKYGQLPEERAKNRKDLFQELKNYVHESATIRSDENPHYQSTVDSFFPQAKYVQHKGRRGCVVGQGELKRGGFDPLFALNHTYAMIRANVNRLFRRTWNTTKKKERLELHLALYALYHNTVLVTKKIKKITTKNH